MTETEERLIAAVATMGGRSHPDRGKKVPAARGIPANGLPHAGTTSGSGPPGPSFGRLRCFQSM